MYSEKCFNEHVYEKRWVRYYQRQRSVARALRLRPPETGPARDKQPGQEPVVLRVLPGVVRLEGVVEVYLGALMETRQPGESASPPDGFGVCCGQNRKEVTGSFVSRWPEMASLLFWLEPFESDPSRPFNDRLSVFKKKLPTFRFSFLILVLFDSILH